MEVQSAGAVSGPRVVGIGLLGGVAALALLLVSMSSIELPPPGVDAGGYISLYRPPRSGFEALLDLGDGQAYAAFAQDPTLSRVDEYFLSQSFVPPLAQRPGFYLLGWALSLGQPGLIPLSFVLVQVIAAGLLAGGGAALIQTRHGRRDVLAALLVVLPPAMTSLRWFGPEVLAVALSVIGVCLWNRGRHAWAVAVLCYSVLTRELCVVVPLVLGVHGFVIERTPVRRLLPLLLPPAVYLACAGIVHRRLDASVGASTGLIESPLTAIGDQVGAWGAADWITLLVAVIFVLAGLVCSRRDLLTWIVSAYALFALTLNHVVWQSWEGFGRVLLPLFVFGILQLLAPLSTAAPGEGRAGDRPDAGGSAAGADVSWPADPDEGR